MADVTNGRGDTAAKMRLLGQVLSPIEIKQLTNLLPGEEAIRHDEFLGKTAEERFDQMGDMIAKQLEVVVEKTRKHSSEGAGKWTPWLHRMSPSDMVKELRRREHLNERVIAHLTRELGVHIAMSVKMRSLIRQAQATMIDEAMDVPKGLQDFIIRMHAAGLKTASVKDLSKGGLDAIVALLNGEVSDELVEAVGLGRSTRFVSDEEARASVEQASRLLETITEPGIMDDLPEEVSIIEPTVPEGFENGWDYENGPIPPEYWSTVQEFRIPYVWEYRMATQDEEDTVLGMMLPEAHDWSALRAWDRNFAEIALDRIRTKKGAIGNIRDIVSAKRGISPDEVDMNLVKTWLLMLTGRLMSEEECDMMFEPDFFEGIVMPCPATGVGVVRQLVKKGE